jgi:transcriptional regulator with XRE-family HTH domain
LKLYRYKNRCNIAGIKIKAWRVKAGLSQEQLAARLQIEGLVITQKQVSRIETGERVLADFELLFFARALDTTTDYLLSE